MNRLWVRFSLVIIGVVIFMAVIPFLLRALALELGIIPESTLTNLLPELRAALSEEVLNQLTSALLENLISNLILFILIGSLLAILAGVLLSRSLAAPLSNLESGVRAIEAQDFSHRVSVSGSQELVTMGQAFNQMAAQLEQAESQRRNMLADVAHELRHPLHVLQGNLQAILDDVYPMEKAEIGRLLDQTRHLTTLVNDLHELAQAEAHQLPLQKQELDIADLVKEMAETFGQSAQTKGVEIKVALLGTIPVMTVDKARIRQTLYNLIYNALQHTPAGSEITIEIEQIGDQLSISVRDSGEGIHPEQLPHVFERFYRANASRSQEDRTTGSGTGLGLAIAKAIVEAHDGVITAESDGLGKGSTFIIKLPIG